MAFWDTNKDVYSIQDNKVKDNNSQFVPGEL